VTRSLLKPEASTPVWRSSLDKGLHHWDECKRFGPMFPRHSIEKRPSPSNIMKILSLCLAAVGSLLVCSCIDQERHHRDSRSSHHGHGSRSHDARSDDDDRHDGREYRRPREEIQPTRRRIYTIERTM
jgi:hypothetical protein